MFEALAIYRRICNRWGLALFLGTAAQLQLDGRSSCVWTPLRTCSPTYQHIDWAIVHRLTHDGLDDLLAYARRLAQLLP